MKKVFVKNFIKKTKYGVQPAARSTLIGYIKSDNASSRNRKHDSYLKCNTY